jgi:Tfp pilus assembly protein PilF
MRLKYSILIMVIFLLVSCGNRDNAQIHYEAGMVYIGQDKLEKAIKELHKAIKHKPEMPEAYYSLSFCYYELGNEEMGSKCETQWRALGAKAGYDPRKLEGVLPNL